MRRPTRKSFGSKAMSGKQMRLQFNVWLNSCTDSRLTSMDPQSLANMYGMNAVEVAALVAAERQRRGC